MLESAIAVGLPQFSVPALETVACTRVSVLLPSCGALITELVPVLCSVRFSKMLPL